MTTRRSLTRDKHRPDLNSKSRFACEVYGVGVQKEVDSDNASIS